MINTKDKINKMLGRRENWIKEEIKKPKYNYEFLTKLKLGNGKVVSGKLVGQKGGDVFAIYVKVNNKWVNADNLGKSVFPISAIGKTPFIDMVSI